MPSEVHSATNPRLLLAAACSGEQSKSTVDLDKAVKAGGLTNEEKDEQIIKIRNVLRGQFIDFFERAREESFDAIAKCCRVWVFSLIARSRFAQSSTLPAVDEHVGKP